MAIRLYDEALVNKITSWIPDNTIQNKNTLTILKPDEATRFFELTLDNINDQPLKLPLLAISRDKNIDILSVTKQSKTFDGFSQVKKENIVMPLNVIPIRIGYQLDIYTHRIAEMDEYIRNFVFNFINYPKLEIKIPYNELAQDDFSIDLHHNALINLDGVITDNSDIKEHLFPDQFVRFTLKLLIEDAYLFSLPARAPSMLEIDGLDLYNRSKQFENHEPLDLRDLK